MTSTDPTEIFTVEFAALAREIAMDIFEVKDIIAAHKLTEEEWLQIERNPKFQHMLGEMVRDWNSALSTRDRIKVKAATGLESQLETFIRDLGDTEIPLNQRVEAGKFLARIGEVDTANILSGGGGSGFNITLNIGNVTRELKADIPEATVIEHEA